MRMARPSVEGRAGAVEKLLPGSVELYGLRAHGVQNTQSCRARAGDRRIEGDCDGASPSCLAARSAVVRLRKVTRVGPTQRDAGNGQRLLLIVGEHHRQRL